MDQPDAGPGQLSTSAVPLLPSSEVVDAVKWQVTFWCNDTYSSSGNYTSAKCAEERVGGTCSNEANWLLTYRADRQVWDVSCGGYRYLVDDNTGDVSSPNARGLSGIDRLKRRVHDLAGLVGDLRSRADDLEYRADDLEYRVDDLERRYP